MQNNDMVLIRRQTLESLIADVIEYVDLRYCDHPANARKRELALLDAEEAQKALSVPTKSE